MTKFNPENKSELTYAEALEPAMGITKEADAHQYKEAYIQWHMKSVSRERAEEIVNANLGYYAGYYSDEVRRRVEKLFICSHPIFGSLKDNGRPTSEEALKCGEQHKTLDEIRNKE